MEQQQRIADFIKRRVPFATGTQPMAAYDVTMIPRLPPSTIYGRQPLPSVTDLARQLVDDAEFQALGLGSWLGTAEGELIAQAVGLVIPPIYKAEYELLINGLKQAAKLQQAQGRQRAGKVALGVVTLVGAIAASRS